MNHASEHPLLDEPPIIPAPDAAAYSGDGASDEVAPPAAAPTLPGSRMMAGREVHREVVYGAYCPDGDTYVEVQVSPGLSDWRVALSDPRDDMDPAYARTLAAVLLCASDEADALNDEIAAREVEA